MKILFFFLSFWVTFSITAQNLKSPSEFLGYELGTKFTRHHRVVDYFEYLSMTAPQLIKLENYGKTNEGRPLFLAYLSSEKNGANLEKIRQDHLNNSEGMGDPSTAIVWLSYNVHGNESASTEASMLTTYELLTHEKDLLENTIVIVDPCINPDGRDRYVNWYNQYANTPNTIDPNSKEHHEPWLNGRANHYMFDLNRDWAWLTQIESQQRIKMYNKWLPHVHVDFHEQGVDAPYYFAPAAEPFHEVITDFQREFQATVGKNHAKYFDANGWFYFTKEIFDLLYPSYGDTYPTYNGGIGMTYEQGGSGWAGLGITTSVGDTLTLTDRIAHHYTTGLSTVEISAKNSGRLNREFKKFFENKNYRYKSYVLNGEKDNIDALIQLLAQHEIEYGWATSGSAKGFRYRTGKNGTLKTSEESLIVSTEQKKGTLVKVLFEPNAKLTDSLTYDITAWSLPYAYGLDAIASENKLSANFETESSAIRDFESLELSGDAYAYLIDWKSFKDAQFLAACLSADIRVRYAKKPFTMDGKRYNYGSLIISRSDNKQNPNFLKELHQIANNHRRNLRSTTTGFVEGGPDFGSNSVQMVKKSKVALLAGGPISTLRFGEIWHFFEQQLQYPISVIDVDYFNEIDLSDYDILIFPDGDDYSKFIDVHRIKNIKEWISKGGKLIGMGSALKAISKEKSFCIKPKEKTADTLAVVPVYEENQREQMKKEITGAIFKANVDSTNPLAFGYDDTYFTLKLGSDAYSYLDQGSAVYLKEGSARPVAGFAGSEAQKKIAKTLIFGVENHDKGHLIYMVDNPLFRGFWENGKLFFANALFMVD